MGEVEEIKEPRKLAACNTDWVANIIKYYNILQQNCKLLKIVQVQGISELRKFATLLEICIVDRIDDINAIFTFFFTVKLQVLRIVKKLWIK